jgi:hypothetical protein
VTVEPLFDANDIVSRHGVDLLVLSLFFVIAMSESVFSVFGVIFENCWSKVQSSHFVGHFLAADEYRRVAGRTGDGFPVTNKGFCDTGGGGVLAGFHVDDMKDCPARCRGVQGKFIASVRIDDVLFQSVEPIV